MDAASARGRVPAHPAARRARRAPARPSRIPRRRDAGPRAQASARVDRGSASSGRSTPGTVLVAFSRKAVLALAGEVNRLHPDRVAVLYGAMPLALAARGDRPLPRGERGRLRRDRRARARRQPPLRDAALRRDDEVRRGAAARPAARGSSPRSPVARGASGSSSAATSACSSASPWASADPEIVESALEPHVELPEGHRGLPDRRRGAHRAAARRPRRRRPARPRRRARPPGTASRRASGRTRAGSRSSRSSRSAAASPIVQRHLRERGRRLGLDDTWQLANAPVDPEGGELLGLLALAVAGDRAQRPLLQFLLDTGTASRRVARGGGGGRPRRSDPPLVRAPVPRGRRRDHRARGGRSSARRRSGSSDGSRSRCATARSAAAASAGRPARPGSRSATAAPAPDGVEIPAEPGVEQHERARQASAPTGTATR